MAIARRAPRPSFSAAGGVRVWVLGPVPREVALAVGVLDVEPEDVVREVERLELAMHVPDVSLVVVVPPALVVAERESGRKRRHARQPGVLPEDGGGRRAGEEEEVDYARLGHPVRGGGGRGGGGAGLARDVDEGLGRVEPEDGAGARRRVREQHRHAAVQRHRRVELVVVHVEGVQPVRLLVPPALPHGGRQVHGRGVLGEAVDVARAVEADVHPHRRGAVRLRVRVRTERLLPQ